MKLFTFYKLYTFDIILKRNYWNSIGRKKNAKTLDLTDQQIEEKKLLEVFTTLKENNNWAKKASMIVAAFSKKELDCLIGSREYFLFDTGMAVGQMILRATELGLVMHPIAGFDDKAVRRLLGIPEEMIVITLLIVGKKSADLSTLTEYQTNVENTRPKRKVLSEFIHFNNFGGK